MGGVVIGALIGILAGYAYSESKALQRQARRTQKAIGKATEHFRLPKPGFRMHLPTTPEDYDIIDEKICECASQVAIEQPGLEGEAQLVAIRDCVVAQLYPDFEWPPVPGDHPSVEQLWTIISYEVGRSAAEGTLCVDEPAEEEVMEDNPFRVQFIPPPR